MIEWHWVIERCCFHLFSCRSKDAAAAASPTSAAGVGASRQLKGVMRVGALSKGLLLHDDLNVELVVLCSSWPTHGFLRQVLDEFCKQLEVSWQRDSR